jgi:hypothetical protein
MYADDISRFVTVRARYKPCLYTILLVGKDKIFTYMKRVSFPGPGIPGIAPQLYKGEESPSNQNTNQETERYNKAHKENPCRGLYTERSKTERGKEIPALALLTGTLTDI